MKAESTKADGIALPSWGRRPVGPQRLASLSSPGSAAGAMAAARPGLAYGNGRSYGDVCLNPGGTLWLTRGLDHFIAFDPASGILTTEAGVLLRDLQRSTLPQGWLLPVTPGTQLITVGGAIANDVHGKNHHVLGSFGDHVLSLTLVRTTGETITCGPGENPEWFAATVGGMGLTGVITKVTLQLRKVDGPWLVTETIPFSDLDGFFALADASEAGWEQTVSWIDCVTGSGQRGLFMRANPVKAASLPARRNAGPSLPVTPPFSMVNRLTLRPFNMAYYWLNRWKAGLSIAHYEPFSYPLDNIGDWNRLYGPKGFYQYQTVVPRVGGAEAVKAMLAAIARSGEGSFLAVLKTFGNRVAPGLMSFPQPGVTLALDFPDRGAATLSLFEHLDAIVRDAGGRIYPAKDARMPRDLFERGYPHLHAFLKFRDPGISSGLSRRLMGF